MKKIKLFLYNIITMVVDMILVSACSGGLDSQWVRTTGGVPLGASSVDTA